MGFSLKPKKGSRSESNTESNIDWKEWNAHCFEKIGDENRIGIICGIIDLGMHTPEDAEFLWDGTPEEEEAAIADKPNTYFEDIKGKRYKRWPQKPRQQIAIMADFPEIEINYGKHFSDDGADEIRPYRHIMNGEWDGELKGIDLMSSPPAEKGGVWTFSTKSYISKIAKACSLTDQVCTKDMDVGELLGGVFCCDLAAKFSKAENTGFLNIRVGAPTKKHEKIPVPEYALEGFGISLDEENSVEALKQLNNKLKKKIETAEDYQGSVLQKQLEAVGGTPAKGASKDAPVKDTPKEGVADKATNVANKESSTKDAPPKDTPPEDVDDDDDDMDDDIPF
jgi:hypothetical protein